VLRIALRSVFAHRVRLLLTATSAVLGVAFVAGMLMLTAALDRTFTDIFTSTATDVQISAKSAIDIGSGDVENPTAAGLVPDAVVGAVRDVPGVADVAGQAFGPGIALLDEEGEVVGGVGPPTLGLTWLSNPELSNASISEGRAPERADEIVVDEITFSRLEIPLGSPVEVVGPDGRIDTVLVGVFRLGSSGGQGGLTLTAFVPEQAQALLAAPGQWSSVVVETAEGSSNAEVAERIAAAIGPGYAIQTREEQVDAAVSALREGLGFFLTIISVFAGIALFVAAFLIYNTFAMLIAQRGRELALLRAVGALRRQVLFSVLIEALVVAVIAAVAGVLLGYLLAQGLRAALEAFGLVFSTGITLTGRSVWWALLLAVVVTTVSAVLPAIRASRTAPVAALRDAGRPAETVGRARIALGVALLAIAVWAMSQALAGSFSALQTAYASGLLLVAGIVLAPALAKGFAAAVTVLLGWVVGVPGRIAGRNASRAPRRVAATASALMIGLALVSGVSVIVASAQQSLAALVERTFVGDLLITRDGRGFSTQIAADVAAVPGVGLVVQQTSGPVELNGSSIQATALGISGDTAAIAPLLGGASPEDLVAGQAVVSESTAAEFGLAVGQEVEVLLPTGSVLTPNVALVLEDNPLLGQLVLPIGDYRDAGGEPDDRAVFVAFDGSAPRAETEAAVRAVVDVNPLLSVFTQTELQERNEEQLDQLLYIIYAMLGLSIVIAALGVVNTMALSVVERTREIGLLRAVGASRRQVRRMIRWEAIIVSTLGGLLGVGIGIVVGAAVRRSLAEDGLEVFSLPQGTIAIVFAAAIVIGVVGAVLPARRAARLDILRSIGAE
jgi:putative ABC transport system permease protein